MHLFYCKQDSPFIETRSRVISVEIAIERMSKEMMLLYSVSTCYKVFAIFYSNVPILCLVDILVLLMIMDFLRLLLLLSLSHVVIEYRTSLLTIGEMNH